MPLKKPSEFYEKNPNSSFDDVKEEMKNASPQQVERITEAFDSFKNNLNNIQSLNDFVESVDTFKANAERVETLSNSVEKIRESIESFTSKKDLDDAMMAHLLFVEEAIRDVQDRVKTLNSKSVLEIKEEFETLSEAVNNFVGEEVPSYKKLIVDSETRVDSRFGAFKEDVKQSFEDLGKDIYTDISDIAANVEALNEESLSSLKEDVQSIGNRVKTLLEKDLPEYKKFFADTELKTEERINESEKKVEDSLKGVVESIDASYKENLAGVEEGFEKVAQNYRKNLVEAKLKSEEEIKKVTGLLASDVLVLDKRIDTITEGVNYLQDNINEKDGIVKNILEEQIAKIQTIVKESKALSNNYRKDFRNREIESDKKLGEYFTKLESFAQRVSGVENHLTENLCDIQENLDTSTSVFHNELKSEIDLFQEEVGQKVKNLHVDFTVNEKHIDRLSKQFQEVVDTIQIDELVETVTQINEKNLTGVKEDLDLKVQELKESLSQFHDENKSLHEENKLLQEGLLNIPPDVKNSDPLTPLDQEYVTLQDLQQHYRLFINRVQDQLATFGGGGARIMSDLEDVDYAGTGISTDGWVLAWDSEISMWAPAAGGSSGAGGTWASDSTGVSTTKNVGIATTARSDYSLYVGGASTTDTVAYFDGNINVAGTIFKREVINIESLGIITGMSDLDIRGNSKILGFSTFGSNNGLGTVHIGVGTTALMVDGDTRIIGILTVGRGSVTIDGENNTITSGLVTVTNSTIYIGAGVSINATASGINSAPNVLYVAKDGNDSWNGTSIDNAFLTVKAAVGAAQSGTTVKVLSGKYTEDNPIEVPAFVSVVGDDQRTVSIIADNTTSDIFHVRKGSKLSNMTFRDHEFPAASVGFPRTEIAENVGGGKWKGPYIQNCTSDTTTGIGVYIDGNQARLLKAMNVDAFTQYNQGGIGVAVTNSGFAQLVSLFTICNNEAVKCEKGGQADIANSNCSFGTYGLVAKGVSELQYTGVVTSSAAISQKEVTLNVSTDTRTISGVAYSATSGIATITTTAAHGFAVGMGVTLSDIGFTCEYGAKTYPYKKPFIFSVDSIPSTTSFVVNLGISTVTHTYAGAGATAGSAKIEVDRPYDGQLCYFDELYENVKSITVTSGGSGYTSTPTITVDDPNGPSGETCTAYATLDGEVIDTITIISSGSQYDETPDVTISGGGGSSGAATANMEETYYTINSSTPVTAGITTVTLFSNLLNAVGVGSTAFFYQASRIIASSHTFEYVGAGNNITDATPKRGGVTIQANEVYTESGGQVLYTSTDQAGNFRIGDDLQINQETGTISGRSFSKSLFNEMTPFILALS